MRRRRRCFSLLVCVSKFTRVSLSFSYSFTHPLFLSVCLPPLFRDSMSAPFPSFFQLPLTLPLCPFFSRSLHYPPFRPPSFFPCLLVAWLSLSLSRPLALFPSLGTFRDTTFPSSCVLRVSPHPSFLPSRFSSPAPSRYTRKFAKLILSAIANVSPRLSQRSVTISQRISAARVDVANSSLRLLHARSVRSFIHSQQYPSSRLLLRASSRVEILDLFPT